MNLSVIASKNTTTTQRNQALKPRPQKSQFFPTPASPKITTVTDMDYCFGKFTGQLDEGRPDKGTVVNMAWGGGFFNGEVDKGSPINGHGHHIFFGYKTGHYSGTIVNKTICHGEIQNTDFFGGNYSGSIANGLPYDGIAENLNYKGGIFSGECKKGQAINGIVTNIQDGSGNLFSGFINNGVLSENPIETQKPHREASPEARAATEIQRVFRGDQERKKQESAAITPEMKRQISDHMKKLNTHIHTSYSAYLANNETLQIASRNQKEIPSLIIENHTRFFQADMEKTSAKAAEYQNAAVLYIIAQNFNTNPSTEGRTESIAKLLRFYYHENAMVCDNLACYLAIILKNDPKLASIKDQINVCQCQRHVFVCIGDPESNDSLVVDPWIRYLVLAPKEGYRKKFSDYSTRKRGFIGDVKSFKEFLDNHNNLYVTSHPNTPLTFQIKAEYTAATNEITPEMIHENPSDREISLSFLEQRISSITNSDILIFMLYSNFTPPDIRDFILKHPLLSIQNLIQNNRLDILSHLTSKGLIDINKQDENGDTPIHYALKMHNEAAAEMLADQFADVEIKNKDGLTAKELAIQMGINNPNLLEALKENFKL